MNSRTIYVIGLLPLILGGCAHGRNYEQIAADQCANAGYVRDSEPHARCAIQIAAAQRQQDEINRQRTSAALIAAGSAMMATQPPQAPNPNRQVCIDAFNKMYRC